MQGKQKSPHDPAPPTSQCLRKSGLGRLLINPRALDACDATPELHVTTLLAGQGRILRTSSPETQQEPQAIACVRCLNAIQQSCYQGIRRGVKTGALMCTEAGETAMSWPRCKPPPPSPAAEEGEQSSAPQLGLGGWESLPPSGGHWQTQQQSPTRKKEIIKIGSQLGLAWLCINSSFKYRSKPNFVEYRSQYRSSVVFKPSAAGTQLASGARMSIPVNAAPRIPACSNPGDGEKNNPQEGRAVFTL